MRFLFWGSVYSFELILFMVWIRVRFLSLCLFLRKDNQLSQHNLLKKNPLTTELSLYFCQKSVIFIFVSWFLDSLFCSIDLCINPIPVPHCPGYYSYIITFKIWQYNSSSLCFFKFILAFLVPLHFHIYFRISLSACTRVCARTHTHSWLEFW